MKIRNDFVSNSSSSSFIISNEDGNCAEAIKLCNKVFSECDIPYSFEDAVDINCHVKNKWYDQVYEFINDEKPYRQIPEWRIEGKENAEEVSWDTITLRLSDFSRLASDNEILNKIDHISFTCQDSDITGIILLRLLYSFFERNQFYPDASDSEHSFFEQSSENDFLYKLVTVCRNKS